MTHFLFIVSLIVFAIFVYYYKNELEAILLIISLFRTHLLYKM